MSTNEAAVPTDKSDSRLVLDDSWMYKLTVLSDLVGRRVSGALQAFAGINLTHWRVLAALADKPGRSASEVVKITPMDKGLVSRAVSHLASEDLIERRSEAGDRRVSRLFLTGKGERTYADILAAIRASDADGGLSLGLQLREDLHDTLTQAIALYRGDRL